MDIDEPPVQLGHARVTKPKPVHRARTEVFNQNIGMLGQPAADVQTFRLLQVHRQALLAAVKSEEVRRFPALKRRPPGAAHIALARALDLDHAGAVGGQNHRAVGTCQRVGKIEDRESLKRWRHPLDRQANIITGPPCCVRCIILPSR